MSSTCLNDKAETQNAGGNKASTAGYLSPVSTSASCSTPDSALSPPLVSPWVEELDGNLAHQRSRMISIDDWIGKVEDISTDVETRKLAKARDNFLRTLEERQTQFDENFGGDGFVRDLFSQVSWKVRRLGNICFRGTSARYTHANKLLHPDLALPVLQSTTSDLNMTMCKNSHFSSNFSADGVIRLMELHSKP
jgi:hypothetical protein